MWHRILIFVLFVLLLVAALLIWRSSNTIRGGAVGGAKTSLAKYNHVTIEVSPNGSTEHKHPLGAALHSYARSLNQNQIVGTHPLDTDHYEPMDDNADTTTGGGPAWHKFKSWHALQRDKNALKAYFKVRADVLNNPDLDWTQVLTKTTPLLKENREYIGIANVDDDGKTVRIVAMEASPLEAGVEEGVTFASVPSELVEKYASQPGMFLFHTHPADPRGSPLPSSHDLAAAIYFGATSRFAACAVISRYGVIVHGLDWSAYKAINTAIDWKLATLNLSHDVVAAHEAIRSWAPYTLTEYLNFYPRHRMLLFTYPSSELIGDTRRYIYLWDLETPIDHEIITEFSTEITDHHLKKSNRTRKPALLSVESIGVPIAFD
jgi:hypothetical protein